MTILIAKVAITLNAPLSIAMPVAEFTRPNEWENFPVMPVAFDDEGAPKNSGFLPATTVRGALRRNMVLPRMEAAAKAGQPYCLKRAYTELVGQDAESEQQPDEINLTAIAGMREASPVVDLMGSGLGVKSRMMVSNFVPDHPTLPQAFTAVRKDLGDTEGVLDALDDGDREKYLARGAANSRRSQAEALVKRLNPELRKAGKTGGDTAEIKAQLKEAEKMLEKCKDDMGEMQVSTRSIMTHYALPAGLTLTGKIVIQRYRERDLDLLLSGIEGLSQFPILGANSARGAGGDITGKLDIKIDGKLVKTVAFGGCEPAKISDYADSTDAP